MGIDKIKNYVFEFILVTFLFFILFVSTIYKTIYLSIFLLIYMLILKKIIKKRNIISHYKKEVTIVMSAMGIIYLIVFYLMGIHFGFYESSVKFGKVALLYYIIPITIIVYSTEVIREIFLAQRGKFAKIIPFIAFVLIDLIIYGEVYSYSNLDDLLIIIGFIVFSSISSNLLYNYISLRYGKNSVVVYRLITILYTFIIPYTPNIYIFFKTFLKIIYPYFIYLFLEYTYSKTNFAVAYKDKKREIVWTTILIIVLSSVTMLISCQFKYGILVIGSKSMTGALNMGDTTIFVKYDKQNIKTGDIIVFKKDGLQIIHRVIDKKDINGTIRYYTKGDANMSADDYYLVDSDIIGISKLRIKYIGYPSIWIKEMFS